MHAGDEGRIVLQIETVTTCNARCHFCPYPNVSYRWGSTMSMDLFKKGRFQTHFVHYRTNYSMRF